MKIAYFDIEGDGLLDEVTRLWCGVIINQDGEVYRYTENIMSDFARDLNCFDVIVGHNILDYDIPALEKITGVTITAKPHDTLVGSRFRFPDMFLHDDAQHPFLEEKGKHSLKAWGERLKFPKGEYEDWTKYTEEMMEYCVQDVRVTKALYEKLDVADNKPFSLEMKFAQFCKYIENTGFEFDVAEAELLATEIQAALDHCTEELEKSFPARVTEMKKPEYWEMRLKPGVPGAERWSHLEPVRGKTKAALQRVRTGDWAVPPKYVEFVKGPNAKQIHKFNPGSRKQVAERLFELYQWVAPTTEKGNPSVDGDLLETLEFPEAKTLARYFMLKKRMGQLADGQNAWLKLVKEDGRIRHRINTIGCATGRVSHSNPNLGQIPATRNPYGHEFRGLFKPHNGMVMVGCDLSGIEARLLAHYLYPYDKGEFADEVLNGDIHSKNQEAAGLPTRDDAKTFFYALMYGAGPAKIGEIVGGKAKEGQKLITSYMEKMPAFKQLVTKVQYMAETNGTINALDGRDLPIRSPHSALNSLLQGGAAIIAKAWSNIMWKRIETAQIEWSPLAFVHDEVQSQCCEEDVDEVKDIMCSSAVTAGEYYNLHVPLAAEASHGTSWADTH